MPCRSARTRPASAYTSWLAPAGSFASVKNGGCLLMSRYGADRPYGVYGLGGRTPPYGSPATARYGVDRRTPCTYTLYTSPYVHPRTPLGAGVRYGACWRPPMTSSLLHP